MKAFLIVSLLLGVTALFVGIGLADYANSPRNRNGNDLADIGVAMGVGLAIVGGVIALASSTALLIKARNNRP